MNNPAVLEEQQGQPCVAYDVFSKLLKDRVIFLGEEINDEMANVIIGELLYLDRLSHEPIRMYINSPGGAVTAGLGIFDTMQLVKSPVHTLCVGQAASMAAVLLAGGEAGHRYSLPHSRMLIHQPIGGAAGQCADVQIAAKEIDRIKKEMYNILSKRTGKSYKVIERDSDRDYWMNPQEALKYGLIDSVIEYE